MAFTHPDYLVSAAELHAALEDPRLRILDATVTLRRDGRRLAAVSGHEAYRHEHVPRARFLDLISEASDTTTGLGFSLPIHSVLVDVFRRLGIDNDSRVVCYSTGHVMWATRAFWLLHYLGHQHVAVLDGGFDAWLAAGLPTEAGLPDFPEGDFVASPRPGAFADREAVAAAIGDGRTCTVNALAAEMHDGTAPFDYGRKGHIAGSGNVPCDRLLADGRFRSPAEVRAELDGAGMLGADRVITYCGGGIAATVDAFACLLSGQDRVAVYDGSLSEWVRDPHAPMEVGPGG